MILHDRGDERLVWFLGQQRQNKLRKDEYDATTWSARTWLSFKAQKVSVALHRSAVVELANALGLSAAVDAP